MSTGKPHLTKAECLAMGDEWAMLSRRSEKWLWLTKAYVRWWVTQGDLHPSRNFSVDGTTQLQLFLDQRHALSQGWNTAYRSSWMNKFNDFYLFALTQRITG